MPTLERHPESWRLDSLEREIKRIDDRVDGVDRRSRKSEDWILFFPLRVLVAASYLLLIAVVVFDVIVGAHH
jgi:hypothetical protein